VSKLIYSFLLGAVLAVVAIVEDLRALGWWTQWLLGSAFWWGAYAHRHQALGLAEGRRGHELSRARQTLAGRMRGALDTPRAAIGVARRASSMLSRPAPGIEQRRKLARAGGERARELADAQAARSLDREHREAGAAAEMGPETQARLSGMRAQLARVQDARERASAAGNTRKAAQLDWRGQRLAGAIAREEESLRQARRTVADGASAQRRTGESPYTREQREERARLLDAQAALPAAGRASSGGERRDYAALASLAGHGREEYERLDPRRRLKARAQIDRELAMRRELGGAAADLAARAETGSLGRREQRKGRTELDRALEQRMRASGHRRPGSPASEDSPLVLWKRAGAAAAQRTHARGSGSGSTVLDDAREVAAGRKRQLGRDRP
jgi:hypothetical protein